MNLAIRPRRQHPAVDREFDGSVGKQALSDDVDLGAGRGIPEPQAAERVDGRDVPPVAREPDVAPPAAQRLAADAPELLPGAGVPDDDPAGAARRHEAAVRREAVLRHPADALVDRGHLARRDLDGLERAAGAARDEVLGSGVELHRRDRARPAQGEGVHFVARGDLDDLDRSVRATAGSEPLAVVADGQRSRVAAVGLERGDLLAGDRVPHLDGTVVGGRGQVSFALPEVAVVASAGLVVPQLEVSTGGDVDEAERVAPHGRGDDLAAGSHEPESRGVEGPLLDQAPGIERAQAGSDVRAEGGQEDGETRDELHLLVIMTSERTWPRDIFWRASTFGCRSATERTVFPGPSRPSDARRSATGGCSSWTTARRT